MSNKENIELTQNANHLTPKWWVIVFIILIIFLTPYLLSPNKPKVSSEKKETNFNLNVFKNFIASNPQEVNRMGKQVYMRKCRSCHGSNGEGGVGPNLTDSYWIHGNPNAETIYNIIDWGIVDRGMAAWGKVLSKEEIMAVVKYVQDFKGTKPANAKSPQGTLYK